MRILLSTLTALLSASLALPAQAPAGGPANPAVAGEIPDDHASSECIAVRWFVEGDANANATVRVAYRKAGRDAWKPAMPLFRVESAAMEQYAPPAGTSLFAGSIFGLRPGTTYEVKLSLTDPDGGSVEKTVQRTTWSEPTPPAPQRTVHVRPGGGGGKGTADEPWLGLQSVKLRPGDLLLLKAGKYQGPLEPPSGTAEAPVVIRGPADGQPAIIDNGGKGVVVRAYKTHHVFLEDLTIQGGGLGIAASGAKHLVIRRCTIRDVANGIYDDRGGRRMWISDNVLTGRVKPGSKPPGEPRAIQLSGSGHEVCYNRCNDWRDAIDTRPPAPRNMAIHHNDVYDLQDDGFEEDFSLDNVRVYANRVTNSPCGISFQSSWGGPNYAVRNVLLMIRGEVFKLHLTPTNRKSKDWRTGPHRTSGAVMINNTAVVPNVPLRVWSNEGPCHHCFLRNNLLVGAVKAGNGIDMSMPFRYASMDHNIYVAAKLRLFAFIDGKRYRTIEDFADQTGQEKHGKLLTTAAGIFAAGFKVPTAETGRFEMRPADNKPVLAADSPAVDAGAVIPTITDAFAGEAPDVGAYEFGKPVPHYGPRPVGGPRPASR